MSENKKDNNIFIGNLDGRGYRQVRVRVSKYHGKYRVDLRVFEYEALFSNFTKPTLKGVNIGMDQVENLIELLKKAKAHAEQLEEKEGGAEEDE